MEVFGFRFCYFLEPITGNGKIHLVKRSDVDSQVNSFGVGGKWIFPFVFPLSWSIPATSY